MIKRSMPPRFKAPCSLWRVFAHMTQSAVKTTMAPPTACNRSAGPAVNPFRSAPGMSSTPSAQSHIRGYRSGGPQSSPSAGLPKSDYAHAAAARPAKAGVSPKAARLAGTGAMSIPRPPGTSCRGPRATSRARPRWPRWPSPRACRGRASRAAAGAARTPSSRASSPRAGHAAALGHQLRLVARLDVAPGPLDGQPPDEGRCRPR